MSEAIKMKAPVCVWVQSDEGGSFATDCGRHFEINDGTPKENGMAWCCFCGHPLHGAPFVEEAGEVKP